jgi:MoaA/NifB/PqqE/SkfB family radical SAM enzyme
MSSSIACPCVDEGCPSAMVKIHLRAKGDVCPCDFTAHSFGDNRQQSLPEIGESMSAHPQHAIPSARCRLSQEAFWSKL